MSEWSQLYEEPEARIPTMFTRSIRPHAMSGEMRWFSSQGPKSSQPYHCACTISICVGGIWTIARMPGSLEGGILPHQNAGAILHGGHRAFLDIMCLGVRMENMYMGAHSAFQTAKRFGVVFTPDVRGLWVHDGTGTGLHRAVPGMWVAL